MKALKMIATRVSRLNTATKSFHTSAMIQKKTHLDNEEDAKKYKLDLAGISPPIPTPFTENEDIDWVALKENIDKWDRFAFRAYVIQGSNGEYAYMENEERVEIVRQVKKMTNEGKLVIGGSGCESTRATIDMTSRMADVGADAALVITPCYYKSGMTDDAMLAHYTDVADQASIPIILYNAPSNTGLDLSVPVITQLAAHPNIIGLKDSGGDITKLGLVVHQTKHHDFQVLAGSASFLFPALQIGCVGGIVALANVLGSQCLQFEKLLKTNDVQEAADLQRLLILPNIDVTRKYGVPGLKQAMEWMGYRGGRTRRPLLPLKESERLLMKEHFSHFLT